MNGTIRKKNNKKKRLFHAERNGQKVLIGNIDKIKQIGIIKYMKDQEEYEK